MTLNGTTWHRRRWPAILSGGLLAAIAVAGPAFAADRPEPPHGAPPGRLAAITPVDGATNVAPTTPVVLREPGRPQRQESGQHPDPNHRIQMRPGASRQTETSVQAGQGERGNDQDSHDMPRPRLVVAVTNAQGTTLYSAQSPTVSVDRAAGTVTWTPAPQTAGGVATSVLGRYTEDSVAFVRGPLPGLSPRARQALRQQGTVTLPGVPLSALLFPTPQGDGPGHQVGDHAQGHPVGEGQDHEAGDRQPAPPPTVRGEIAGIQGRTLTFFGGQTVTLPADTRVQIPGVPHATLGDLRLGEFVRVHLPPIGLRPAAVRRTAVDPPAPPAIVQVLPTPGVVDTVFTTGSAVGEPVVWRAQVASTRPSVLTGDVVTVTARDSYGNPATTGGFQVRGQATPSLDASFQAPAGTVQNGQGQSLVTDHKAQAVALTVQTQGPFAQDTQTLNLGTVQFQPGPPADMTIQAASPLAAGGQEAVVGVVTDVYGNPVLPSALDLTASAGGIASPVTTQAGTGAYSTEYTAPDKLTGAPGAGETVTLAGRSEQGSAAAQTQVTVNPGPVAQLTLQAPSQVLAGQSATITGTAADVYGNAVLNGTAIDLAASAGSLPASAQTQGGQFQAAFQAPSQPGPATITATAHGVSQTATIQVVAPAPSGSRVKISLGSGGNGAVAISGTVTSPSGAPVANAPVTLTVVGASPSSQTVVTNGQGAFSAQVTPAASQGSITVTAGVPTQGGGQATGQGWIDPIIYGNQAWTDTGLVVNAGQLVCVQATGGWVNQLYASVGGSQGAPVRVGANGCFVSGTTGMLFLGTDGQSQSGTVDANVAITTPANVVPTLDLTTSASSVSPGGQATISGQLMAGQYPVVGATVDLSATAGSLGAQTVTTNGQGQFQTTWTAPQSGSTTITASYQPSSGNAITQTVSETVSGATTPAPITGLPNLFPFTTLTGTTLNPGWSESGNVVNFPAGSFGRPSSIGSWIDINYPGSVSFQFTVPSGESATLTYGIPAQGFLNDAPVSLAVNGQAVAAIPTLGGVGSVTSTALSLWSHTFGPGTYTITWTSQGNGIDVAGLWASNPSAVQPGAPQASSPPPSSSNPLPGLFWSSLGAGTGYNQWEWVQNIEPPTCSYCVSTQTGPYVGMLQYSGISGNGAAAAYVPAPAGANFTQLSWQGFVYNGISTMAPASVVAVVQTGQGVSLQTVWTVPDANGFIYGGPTTITLPPNTVGLVMVVHQVNANWFASNWMLLLNSPTVTLSTGGTSPLFPASPTTETGSPGFPVPA